jgi:hypothetical protein
LTSTTTSAWGVAGRPDQPAEPVLQRPVSAHAPTGSVRIDRGWRARRGDLDGLVKLLIRRANRLICGDSGRPVNRSQVEADHLAWWAAGGRWCCPPVVGIMLVEHELPNVLDLTARSLENPQGAALGRVVQDGPVAAGEGLVAALAAAGVVEGTIWRPFVEVAMRHAGTRVSEDENVGGGARGADAALRGAAVALVKRGSPDALAGL